MLNACANGAKAILVTGDGRPKPPVRYKMSCRFKLLIMWSLQKRLLRHRYKISSQCKILCFWDLSRIWSTHRYKRSWSKPPCDCYRKAETFWT